MHKFSFEFICEVVILCIRMKTKVPHCKVFDVICCILYCLEDQMSFPSTLGLTFLPCSKSVTLIKQSWPVCFPFGDLWPVEVIYCLVSINVTIHPSTHMLLSDVLLILFTPWHVVSQGDDKCDHLKVFIFQKSFIWVLLPLVDCCYWTLHDPNAVPPRQASYIGRASTFPQDNFIFETLCYII